MKSLNLDCEISQLEKANFEDEYSLNGLKLCLFRSVTFYFPKSMDDDDCPSLSEIQGKFYGGSIEPTMSDKVTHVVMEDTSEDIEEVKKERRDRLTNGKKLFYIISNSWVDDCVQQNRLRKEEEYLL